MNYEKLPLSYAQQRLWFLDQLEPNSPFYNIPLALHLEGNLKVDALEKSLQEIIQRHEALRTNFITVDGNPIQIIKPESNWKLTIINSKESKKYQEDNALKEWLEIHSHQPFDLANESLIRATLLKLSDTEHFLLICLHHVVSDGWSMGVFIQELTTLYNAYTKGLEPLLNELPIQYADFAIWQREYLQGEILQNQLNYWQKQLAAAPALLHLPTDRPRPPEQRFEGDRIKCILQEELSQGLNKLSREKGVTLFMTLLTAFKVLLYRYTGQTDILVGTPIANRTHSELAGLIGFFVNTLVLRTDLAGNPSFSELLKQVRETATDAYDYQDLPFEMLVEALQPERNMSYTPLFQVMFGLDNEVLNVIDLEGIKATPQPLEFKIAKFDLSLFIQVKEAGLTAHWEYNTDLFNESTIERLSGHFVNLLKGIIANPDQPIGQLPLLTESERHQLLIDWNQTQINYQKELCLDELFEQQELCLDELFEQQELCLHHLFEQQVEQNPKAIAVRLENEFLTYQELNDRANQLANYLQFLGVKAEEFVGIFVERSLDMIIGILGILKAGGAYVPIDVNYPKARITYILEDTKLSILLIQAQFLDQLPEFKGTTICLDQDWSIIAKQNIDNPIAKVDLHNLAYIIYTSGSTGKPKGVMIEHRSIVNFILTAIREYGLTSEDKILQFASICFDASVEEIFCSLLSGATLVMRTEDMLRSSEDFWQACEKWQLTVLILATAYWQQLVSELNIVALPILSNIKLIAIGGEAIQQSKVKQWHTITANYSPLPQLFNGYGPTEGTIITTLYEFTSSTVTNVPIGRPISNIQVYILDTFLQPVPIGVAGELHIGGAGLARGYLNRPELTQEKFIPNPFEKEIGSNTNTLSSFPNEIELGKIETILNKKQLAHLNDSPQSPEGSKLYKTGDLVRYLPDGNIEYLGRIDNQVKIRGFRIELGEIETILSQHSNIKSVIVTVYEDITENQNLVAYIVSRNHQTLNNQELRQYLKSKLPEYMIPSCFMQLESLPLNTNGKIDRSALPKPDLENNNPREIVAPRSPIEEMLAQTWGQILNIKKVGINDNFFELGGHSLLATQLVSRIRNLFKVQLPLRKLFAAPTVAQLAQVIKELKQTGQELQDKPILVRDKAVELPLSFAQTRLWFLDQFEADSSFYNIPLALRLKGTLNQEVLIQSLTEICDRHEALRTNFITVNGVATQVIQTETPWTVSIVNLQHLSSSEQEIATQVIQTETPWTVSIVDLQHLSSSEQEIVSQELGQNHAIRSFDLANEPLIRATLVILSETEHILLVCMHHIVSDGWSMGIFFQELTALYNAYIQNKPSSLNPLPIQYGDYTLWQRKWLQGDILQRQLDYWQKQLADAPALLSLPTDRPRPAVQTFAGAHQNFTLSLELTQSLIKLSQEQGTTLFMTLLAAFDVLLYRYTEQEDILVGTPIANRNRGELESLIGFFVNTLVLRTDLSGNPSFTELLIRVREMAMDAYDHQDLPFEMLVEALQPERDLSHAPLFQVDFLLQNEPLSQLELTGLTASPLLTENATAKFDLTLGMQNIATGLQGVWEYNTDLFDRSTIERLAGNFVTLLEAVVTNPQQQISQLPLLTEVESQQLLKDWNATEKDYPFHQCVHHLFEEQAERTPDAVAVVFEGQELTYQQLNIQANQLAHYLQSLGVKSEVLVGIYLERSLLVIIGLLAVLKAGGAYVPLDPDYPQQRLTYMAEDAQISLLLTQQSLLNSLPIKNEQVIVLNKSSGALTVQNQKNTITEKVENSSSRALTVESQENTITEKVENNLSGALTVQNQENTFTEKVEKVYLDNSSEILTVQNQENTLTEKVEKVYLDNSSEILTLQNQKNTITENVGVIVLDKLSELLTVQNQENPVSEVVPENLLCVLYTSGSTGKPKGVMLAHEALVNHSWGISEVFGLTECDRVLQFASFGFDVAAEEIFPTWLKGGTVVLRPRQMFPTLADFADFIEQERLTLLNITPAYWHEWAIAVSQSSATVPSSLRVVAVGGDAVLPETVNIWRQWVGKRVQCINVYGPTEASVTAIVHDLLDYQSEKINSVLIGRPIANTKAYILDQNLQPAPIGVKGELHLCGVRLARGYLNRPELTAEKFIDNPFEKAEGRRQEAGGSKLYKTGDLARYLRDGRIECFGRIDNQVKIRGFRIELGEIEAVLNQHIDVQTSCVIIREDNPGDKYLVAYVVSHYERIPIISELRQFLSSNLPLYMVPQAFVFLESLPLTTNRKVDRRALPAPDLYSDRRDQYVAPRNAIEEMLAQIWTEILKVEQVGIYDNFFEIGGHSLLATQLVSRIRNLFKIELPLRSLFGAATVAELGHLIGQLQQPKLNQTIPTILPRAEGAELVLSFAQTRLWFLAQLQPNSALYNIPLVLRLDGNLHQQALLASLQKIRERHEILRANFVSVDGQPTLIIQSAQDWTITIIDLSQPSQPSQPSQLSQPLLSKVHPPQPSISKGGLERDQEKNIEQIAKIEGLQPFNLANESLFRASLVILSETEQILFVCMHHIVSDGWSMEVFIHELTTLYRANLAGKEANLTPLPIQYPDFAIWQRQWLQGEVLQNQLNYWQKQLAGAPALLSLPTDRPRPAMQTFVGAYQKFNLSDELSLDLMALSQKHGVTLFMTLLAAFDVLLHRYTGETDILVGSPIANRNYGELEGLIGFFANTLVLRANLADNPSFTDLLAQVRMVALDAYAHQDLPFEMLVEALQPQRDLSHTPLFQVAFVLQHQSSSQIELPDLVISDLPLENTTAKFDLTLAIGNTATGLVGAFEYNTDLFDSSTIERMASHFVTLLEGIAANPQERVGKLPLLTQFEQNKLLIEWNDTRVDYPEYKCIYQLFEEQAERTPDAVAVVFEDQQLTYSELNCRANQLAHYLQKLGIKSDTLVGICVERSLEMIVGLLGILKAGGAYVPLDPDYPQERLSFMLEDTQVKVLLTQEKLLEFIPKNQSNIICLDTDWTKINQLNQHNLNNTMSSENLAYVIYTSGSTGKPKGVTVTHQAVNRLVLNTNYIHLTSDDHVAQVANIAFDAATFEIWGALLNGAKVVIINKSVSLSPDDFAAQIKTQKISVLFLTTALFNQLANFVPQVFSSLRYLLFGGEAVDPKWVQEVLNQGKPERLLHVYGPTENTTFSSWYLVENLSIEATTIPIGRPISNTQLYILDQNLQPVPVGIPGELYLGGAGLAKGYLNRPELTQDKFIPNPFENSKLQPPTPKLYKTGDLCRYLPDGNIEYLGRIDNQVKVRGFRIELGEIEALLNKNEDVQGSCVMAREDNPGDKRLVAYVVPQQKNQPIFPNYDEVNNNYSDHLGQSLKANLKKLLPDYMVPSAFVVLDALPLTPNGKIDRRALPAPDLQSKGEYIAPRNPIEEKIAQIWAEVLKLERVSIENNFFELGGHSLLATQVISRCQEAFEIILPLRYLFESPTIAQLGAVILNELQTGLGLKLPSIVPVNRLDDIPLSWAQERLWFVNQLEGDSGAYTIDFTLRLVGNLNVKALEQSFQAIIQRHEPLRTQFKLKNNKPIQVIASNVNFTLPVVNVQNLNNNSQNLRDAELQNFRQNQDLTQNLTNFETVEQHPSQISQRVTEANSEPFNTVRQNSIKVQQLIKEAVSEPFDLANGSVLRVKLWQVGTDEYVLLLAIHHIAADGWSLGVLIDELSAYYRSFCTENSVAYDPSFSTENSVAYDPSFCTKTNAAYDPSFSTETNAALPPLLIQYADFAVWQRQWLTNEVLERQLSYWKQQLKEVPLLHQLPTDRPRPAIQSFRGGTEQLRLDSKLTQQLKKISQESGSTLFMTLLAGFAVLLSRYSGQTDLVIGSPIANRNRTEIEGLIGFFVNSLVLRFDLSQEPTFEDFLAQVRQTTQNAYDHQDLPFEMLVEELQIERHLDRNPLIQIVFALQNAPSSPWDFPGVKIEDMPSGIDSVRVDLEVYLWDAPEGLGGFCSYNRDLFDAETIVRMMTHFKTLLAAIVKNPQQPVALLPLLTQQEQYQLLEEWNDTQADYIYNKCIHQLIEEQAERTPDAIAVVFENQSNREQGTGNREQGLKSRTELTYRELNSRANQLAHYLRSLGLETEVIVGLCVERSLEMIVALMGILKAGGAYLPLDPEYPLERLQFMLEDSQVSLLLTQGSLVDKLPNHQAKTLFLEEIWLKTAQHNQDNLTKVVTFSNLANVIYTSGSTGKPKGVMIEHKGLCNLAQAQIKKLDVHSSSRVLQFASFSFDACISEILMALGAGATLYLATKDALMPGMPLIEQLRDHQITHVTLPPSALAVLPLIELPSLQTLIVAGEACSPELVKQWSVGRNFFNGYGPTEGSVCATIAKCTPFEQKVTIGRPIINVQVYILDSHLQPVPIGVPGEIHIGGAGVARGYLNRPELTQEKFIPNLFDLPFAPLNKEGVEDVENLTNKGSNESKLDVESLTNNSSNESKLDVENLTNKGSNESKLDVENLTNKGSNESKLYNESNLDVESLTNKSSNESKLYKTGDLARYLPDGTIEYLGRIDNQVKVRGFRIELGEIEATLSQHPLVQEAIVIARGDSPGDHGVEDTSQTQNKLNTNLVGYLVPALKSQVLPEQLAKWQSEYVSDWQKLYEESYSQSQTLTDDPTFNISGWNSSYTGQAIPAEEMREWVENTVSRILAVRQGLLQTEKPQRVLEIGCGSGLLLFRVAEHCQEYWGADYSSATIGNLERICSKIEGLNQKVRLLHRTADNFDGIPQAAFDTVVINSVVQYFPSVDYLLQVLEGAINAIADQGKIFVGDVRSLPLLESYHAAVQLARAEADKTVEQWQQQVNQSVAAEEELLIDPKFFIALKQRFPQISWVEIEPKRGQSLNELTQFRYDVTLHLNKNSQKLAQDRLSGAESQQNYSNIANSTDNQVIAANSTENPVIAANSTENPVIAANSTENPVIAANSPQSDVTKRPWLNWQRDGFSFSQLQDKLKSGQPTWLGIRDVPNQRVQEALQILDWLENPPEVSTVGELRLLLPQKQSMGINPEQIWQLGQQLGYTVHISWWEGSQDGSFDVVFCQNHLTSENVLDESALSELTSREVEVSNLQPNPSFWDNELTSRKVEVSNLQPNPSFWDKETVTAKPLTDYTNNPLYGKLVQRLVPQVREFIQQKLPSYMVPQAFVLLNALPLTPNGKVDRRALPAPDTATRNLATGFVAPRTPIEAQMSQIWSEVLGLERIGIKDNFFELGGHSLLATQVISRSRDIFSVELSLQNLLEYPTIANLAQIIEVLTVAQQGQSTITETLEDYEEGEL